MTASPLDIVVRLTAAIGTADTLGAIYDAALDGLRDGFDVDRASVLLFDPDGVLRFKAWRGLSDDYRAAVEGHTPWTRGQPAPDPIVLPDVRADASLRDYAQAFEREGIVSLAFVPLVANGQVIGKFMLYGAAPRTLTSDELGAAQAIGLLLGFAVERTRLLSESQRLLGEEAGLRQRLTTLTDGSHGLLTSVAASSVVSEVLDLAKHVIEADGYAVWRKRGDAWRIVGSQGLSARFTDGRVAADTGHVFDRAVVAVDLDATPMLAHRRAAYAEEGLLSLVSVPLAIRGEPEGSIVFYFRSRHEPSESELGVGVALGHLAAAAISNAELYETREAVRRRAAFLAEASARLSSLDYEGNLREIARFAVPTLCDWCAVDLLDDRGGLRRLAITHVDPAKVALAEEVHRRHPIDRNAPQGIGRVLRTGEAELYAEVSDDLLVQAAQDEEHLRLMREMALRSLMILPLATRSGVFGVMTFVASRGRPAYTSDDLEVAAELARRAGLALENARLYQEAQRANRLKDEFVATLSHELRTPLNVILGRARMLASATDLDSARQAADVIDRNSVTLARLVDDLLDISRITVGQVKLERRPVDIAAVVHAAVQATQGAADAKGLSIVVDAEPSLPPILGDPTRLQQIVWNLLTNAVKFTPPSGTITVAARRAGARIALFVSDTGEGITPEALPRVFEMFWQGEDSLARTQGGLGLGLSIVRRLAELHGGDVSASSDGPGRGSTFRVLLPAMSAGDERPRARSEEAVASED